MFGRGIFISYYDFSFEYEFWLDWFYRKFFAALVIVVVGLLALDVVLGVYNLLEK